MKTRIACMALIFLGFGARADEVVQFKTGSTVYICDHTADGDGCGESSPQIVMQQVTLKPITGTQYLEGEYTTPVLTHFGQQFQTHISIDKVTDKSGVRYLFYIEIKSAPNGDWTKALVSNEYAFTTDMANLNALHFTGRTLFTNRTIDGETVKEELVPDFYLYPNNNAYDDGTISR